MPLPLAILDIDCFKHVNDTFGHLEGDDVLFELAKAIKYDLRPSHYVHNVESIVTVSIGKRKIIWTHL
ncbi:MAG: diguanylate cyclase (GGDEF)-like protein [Bermanella sp.]|jgi:diguanylate cyclase (GGDEF)-like protein